MRDRQEPRKDRQEDHRPNSATRRAGTSGQARCASSLAGRARRVRAMASRGVSSLAVKQDMLRVMRDQHEEYQRLPLYKQDVHRCLQREECQPPRHAYLMRVPPKKETACNEARHCRCHLVGFQQRVAATHAVNHIGPRPEPHSGDQNVDDQPFDVIVCAVGHSEDRNT